MSFLNLPNLITLGRLFLIPVFLYFALWRQWREAFWIFFIAGGSDLVDGALARLLKQKTRLGAFLDPMADKLLMTAGFMTLTVHGRMDLWLTLLVFSRDLMISSGVIFLKTKKIFIEYRPTFLSKGTTFFQLVTLVTALLSVSYGVETPWNDYDRLVTAVMTVLSWIHYLVKGIKILRRGHA
ncbi:MAG: CDP-alcohol phosphatidyltransferase family protein [Deltaproteobacteria bacterium]|nr:CDP-alcohol phosphatidyltransferase family protein [Deltaproteobacteria bacterium]MBI4196383.1 CDP-alcohol phosphatidyltransferase family protein [Deltaproteobacteria bacterium]